MWRWWSRSPEGGAPQQAQAAARPTGNHATLPGGGRNRSRSLADYQNSAGEGAGPGGEAASLRIAEGNGAEGPASAEAPPEEADNSTSANNSFLLGGGMGEAATPAKEDLVGGVGAAAEEDGRLWRRSRRWTVGAAGGAGSPFGGGGGPGGGGFGEAVADSAAVDSAEAAGVVEPAAGPAIALR